MTHLLRITAATAAIILCTLLPFFPGRYDSLAVPLSEMSHLLGKAGLLLVPVGALWVASRYWSRLTGKQYVFAIAALITSSGVWVIVSLGAFVFGGVSLGLGAFALWAYVLFRVTPRLRPLKGATSGPASAVGFYLLFVPVAAVLLQMALLGPATEFSRSRAIRNSSRLITDIERYRAARGQYPPSLLAVWKDYWPSVIGIKEFHYETSGDAYNLFFEQLTFQFGTKEIVMYNPRDQHVMTSHAMDLLQRTPEELERMRGVVRTAPEARAVGEDEVRSSAGSELSVRYNEGCVDWRRPEMAERLRGCSRGGQEVELRKEHALWNRTSPG